MTPENRLEWQSELDSAMSDLDSKLRHPRRRAGDVGVPQPTLPELGQFDVTNELLDEIAWRVAEQMRRTQAAGAPAGPGAPSAQAAVAAPPPPTMPHGAALIIRLRKPLFSWKFWRRRSRRREAMIPLSDYRVT